MVIKEKLVRAINKQINIELYSSYLYLAMAAYFESNNWMGFAQWMKVQLREENSHAMKFYEYLVDRGGRVGLSAIDAPDKEWKSALGVFEAVYAHEVKVTAAINELLKLAKDEADTATEAMLQWFITEQVEEEANATLILEKLKMIKDSTNGLFMLDHELGERK